MKKVDILKRLVEYAESAGLQHPIDVLDGITQNEMIEMSKTFENLAAFTKDTADKLPSLE